MYAFMQCVYIILEVQFSVCEKKYEILEAIQGNEFAEW